MSNGVRWRIVVTPRAEKELKRLPPKDQVQTRKAIDALDSDPRSSKVTKLHDKEGEWRLRVG